jgi:hypothetical protein
VRSPGPLRAFYERVARRRGNPIAAVAVARKLAVIIWHLLRNGAGLQVEAVMDMDMEQTSEPVASVIAGSSVPADEATVWLLVRMPPQGGRTPCLALLRFVSLIRHPKWLGSTASSLRAVVRRGFTSGLPTRHRPWSAKRADNPTMRPEYVARVIQGMPAALRRPAVGH